MNKILVATCQAGAVTADGVPVPIATILSKGLGASQGIILLDGDKAWFIPNAAGDLDATLQQVISALGQAKTALDKTVSGVNTLRTATAAVAAAVDGVAPGTSAAFNAATVSVVTDMASITTAATAIQTAKTALEQLKEVLK